MNAECRVQNAECRMQSVEGFQPTASSRGQQASRVGGTNRAMADSGGGHFYTLHSALCTLHSLLLKS